MKAPFVLSAWLGLSAALCGQAPEPPTITTTGVGKVKVKPDLVRVSFALTASAETVKEAREKVTAQAKKVAEGLRQMRPELDVQQGPGPAEAASSRGFGSAFGRPKDDPGKFRATHSFVVVVRSMEPEQLRVAASRVLELGLETDAESSPLVHFFKQDETEAQRQALSAATADALANAHAIADGAKVKVADIIAITCRERGGQVFDRQSAQSAVEPGGTRRTVPVAADIEITCVVAVKVRIQK